jgi:ABC-type taurine transport system ATPase subunit
MMIEQKIKDALTQIWGSESHKVIFLATPDGRLYAECEFTFDRRRLTDTNYRDILNDMFYVYCLENAAWMGVS